MAPQLMTDAMDSFLQQQFDAAPRTVLDAPSAASPIVVLEMDETQAIADALRSRKTYRDAIEMERRVEYFRGKDIRRCFPDASPDTLASYGHSLLYHGFIHRSEKVATAKKLKGTPTTLAIAKDQAFATDGLYTWMYEGSATLRNVLTVALVCFAGLCTLYPLWPLWAQSAVWNSGVTLALASTAVGCVRVSVWLSIWLATGRHVWLLPSFPLLTSPLLEEGKAPLGSMTKRLVVATALVATAAYFVYNPMSFGKRGAFGFGRQLVREAYKGTVLNRFSQQEKDFVYSIFRVLRRLLV
ncbi:hypothetical protein SDRG_09364 [Saprolegnia diclina VS20]|uniref:Translocation protein SEC62 n=1 Tax=Saprolegnia diclina (strain VS20) TaxID=1156394 RepID=T0QDJ9_SAPDV|nr:hypothetical protein SDRG_09364 [Saprolegnia diclina VS20]EQC32826.1 hypothetical protein SDRG_09364 [Saprolegnia diclina VS20]|eukprot:XP_008613512.1 hypothetical protein SDRG_09364 [Saprolegnia diclina VS20]